MSYFETIYDGVTGEETIRPFTKEEIAAMEAAAKEAQTQREAAEEEARANATAKTDLLAKLGITEEEAKLLLS